MNACNFDVPPGFEILQAGGKRGTGNILLLDRGPSGPRVLKLYRCRRSPLRERLRGISQALVEGKRGASARARCETERWLIDLWTREGFAVVPRLDAPLPPDVPGPANWLAYMDAPSLRDVLASNAEPESRKREWIHALGRSLSARHARAVSRNEPSLAHEHGNINHYFAVGGRLIAFDLENGYQRGFPALEAVARELEGVARSLIRLDPTKSDARLAALVEGYADADLLVRVLKHGLSGGGVARRVRRWMEREVRGPRSKSGALAHLQRLLEAK